MNLVTGATGLLGSHLTKLLLSKGEKVRALKRSTSSLKLLGRAADSIEWIEGDILDIEMLQHAMQGVHTVYHCAAVISFLPSEVDYMMATNVTGTANVMNAALTSGIKKMVHVSSVASMGFAVEGKVIDEKYSDPNINKAPMYYRSKQYAEREAWRAQAEGLNVVVACPSTIIGPGNWGQEPNTLFPEIHKGLLFYTEAQNGFVDVNDAANCIYLLGKGDYNGEKFIISSENQSFKNLMWQIADELKVKRPGIRVNGFLLGLIWRFEALRYGFARLLGLKRARPLLTRETAKLGRTLFTFSNAKVLNVPGVSFRPLAQSIRETAAAYLKSIG